MTPEDTTEKDETARRAAVRVLRNGLASPSEVAELAGVSRQLVGHWISKAGIDWRRARSERLAREWSRLLRAR